MSARHAFGPSGAAACSHGWSAAEPVERVQLSGTRGKGLRIFCDSAPEGQRNYPRETRLVAHVLLVKFDAVCAQETEKLGIEVLLLVMFVLPRDVLFYGFLL